MPSKGSKMSPAARERIATSQRKNWQSPAYRNKFTNQVSKVCPVCGKTFSDRASHIDARVFCSLQCRAIHLSRTERGEGNPFYGRRHTDTVKKIISKKNAQQ